MERYFEKPILLIEFDDYMEFKLQDPYASGPSSIAQGGELGP